MPFAKFLERENIIDRFQKTPPSPMPQAFGPLRPACGNPTDDPHLGRHIDVLA
jgi:hypothetical protein